MKKKTPTDKHDEKKKVSEKYKTMTEKQMLKKEKSCSVIEKVEKSEYDA